MDPLWIKITVGTGITLGTGIFGWMFRSWLSNLIGSITTGMQDIKADMTSKFQNLYDSINDVKEGQSKQNVTMAQLQSGQTAMEGMIKDIKQDVHDHSKRIRELEVRSAEVNQWKKDKEFQEQQNLK